MNRRRLPIRRDWPANLYCHDGYYSYRNPLSGKKKGLGRDKAKAFSEARAANKVIATMDKSSLAQWVSGIEVMTFKEWLPQYQKLWKEKKNPAETTLKAAERYLNRFAETAFAHLPLNQVTTVHVAKYLDEIAENSGIGTAINMRTRMLDVFSYAISKGHVETGRNPVEATIPPNYAPKRDRLSLEQFLAMREKASSWLACAMNLALLTAQRVSDISEMKFSDCKLGYLHVEQRKSQGDVKIRLDLNIRLAAVDLSIGDVIKQCRRDKIASPYLVHHKRTLGAIKTGAQITEKGISTAFKELRDKLKIGATSDDKTPPTFHEIRSLAERLYRKECGKEFAQAMLGHKSETMTAKYDDLRGSGWQDVTAK